MPQRRAAPTTLRWAVSSKRLPTRAIAAKNARLAWAVLTQGEWFKPPA